MITPDNLPSIISAVCWPLVVVGLVSMFIIVFRKQTEKLFTRLQSAKLPGGTEASFTAGDALGSKTDAVLAFEQQTQSLLTQERSQAEKNLPLIKEVVPGEAQEAPQHEQAPPNLSELLQNKEYAKAREVLLDQIKTTKDKTLVAANKTFAAWILSQYDFNGAIEEFRELVKEYRAEAIVYSWFANLYNSKGLSQEAISVYDQGIERVNDPTSLQLGKIHILELTKQTEQVLELALQIIRSGKDSANIATAYTIMGKVLRQQGNLEEARKIYLQAYFVSPTTALSSIAEFFENIDDFKTALFFRRKLVDLNSDSSYYWTVLGNTYLSLNMNGLAMYAYEKGEQLSGGSEGWILANIGNLYHNVGLYSSAVDYLQKAIGINPEDEYATDRLNKALTNKRKEQEKAEEILQEVSIAIASREPVRPAAINQ